MSDSEILDYLEGFDTVSVSVTPDQMEVPMRIFAVGDQVFAGPNLRRALIAAINEELAKKRRC